MFGKACSKKKKICCVRLFAASIKGSITRQKRARGRVSQTVSSYAVIEADVMLDLEDLKSARTDAVIRHQLSPENQGAVRPPG